MRQVLTWALRHDLHTPMALLGTGGQDSAMAIDVLAGIAATEDREKSGIFSTTAGPWPLTARRRALSVADHPNFDPGRSPSAATPFTSAPRPATKR